MASWNPAPIIVPFCWGNAHIYAWYNWKPGHTKALGRKPILLKFPDDAFLDYYGPSKRPKIENGVLFDLIPMDIINVINDWIIGLEHNETFNTAVTCIKIP